MTRVDPNLADLHRHAPQGEAVVERMRLAKEWDKTLNDVRVVERQVDEANSPREQIRGLNSGAVPAMASSSAIIAPKNHATSFRVSDATSRSPAITPIAIQSHIQTTAAEPLIAAHVSSEPAACLDVELKVRGAIINSGPKPHHANDESEPAIKLLRDENGLTVLIRNPNVVSQSDVSQLVSSIRQATPLRVRSIRLNGNEVYSDMRCGNPADVNADTCPACAVDVKF